MQFIEISPVTALYGTEGGFLGCAIGELSHLWAVGSEESEEPAVPGIVSGGSRRSRIDAVERKIGRHARVWRQTTGWRSGQSWKDHCRRRRQAKPVFVTLF